MSVRHLCDRCDKDLNKEAYQRGLVAKSSITWKFWTVKPVKDGFNDLWRINRESIELCQKCTKDFMEFKENKKEVSTRVAK